MPTFQTDLFLEAQDYVARFMGQNNPSGRYFHNIQHTRFVFAKCEELAQHYDLSWPDAEVLYLAAWFQNIGYCNTSVAHERESVKIFFEYLQHVSVSSGFGHKVESLILATCPGHTPTTLLEKILKDADAHDVSSEHFLIWSQMRRQELAICEGIEHSDAAWLELDIAYLQAHQFHTKHAWQVGQETKERNLQALIHQSLKSRSQV